MFKFNFFFNCDPKVHEAVKELVSQAIKDEANASWWQNGTLDDDVVVLVVPGRAVRAGVKLTPTNPSQTPTVDFAGVQRWVQSNLKDFGVRLNICRYTGGQAPTYRAGARRGRGRGRNTQIN